MRIQNITHWLIKKRDSTTLTINERIYWESDKESIVLEFFFYLIVLEFGYLNLNLYNTTQAPSYYYDIQKYIVVVIIIIITVQNDN